jgi:hypothetical protein
MGGIRLILTLMLLAHICAAQATRFVIIGDYGANSSGELAVSQMVRTRLKPDFVVSAGDNNYIGAANIDTAIGQYYHEFIGSYAGGFGTGASSNCFFPALGNHDWDPATGFAVHLNYFTLPGNERYYDFVRGPVHVFILNSDSHEPDGNTAGSLQARWFSNRLAASTSPWRVVIAQDPPYSSTDANGYMRWPFEQWGASVVISGDSHQYERIMLNGFPYVVNGAGGAPLSCFGSPSPGSVVRYNANYGAMLVTATTTNIAYEFWSAAGGGTLIDSFAQQLPPAVSCTTMTDQTVRMTWPTNGTERCVLEWAPTLSSAWNAVTTAQTTVGAMKSISISTTNATMRYFRLRR